MAILAKEISRHPSDLFQTYRDAEPGRGWWVIYTLSRREKTLMRWLLARDTAFYCPIVPRRYRSPNGRLRESHSPLFPGYVFVYGDRQSRLAAFESGCVSRCMEVPDGPRLFDELQQIQRLIATGAPLAPESRLFPGDLVRVKSGPFAGFEGNVIRREGEVRLLVAVSFMEQGASVQLDDCQLELVESAQVRRTARTASALDAAGRKDGSAAQVLSATMGMET